MCDMLLFLLPADQDTPSPKSKPLDVLPPVPRLPNFAPDGDAKAGENGDAVAPAGSVAAKGDGWVQCSPEAGFG